MQQSLRLINISKEYPEQGICFEGQNFEIHPGEKIAVLGSNGSGKTTLLKILATLTHASSGHIEYKNLSLPKDEKKYTSIIF